MEISASKALVSVHNARNKIQPIEPRRINATQYNRTDGRMKPFVKQTVDETPGTYRPGREFTAYAVKGTMIDIYA